MPFFADLHIHSHYSRATSKDMTPEAIWKWAQLKGILVAGTGDFTHPGWFSELTKKLDPAGDGLFCLREEYRGEAVPASCAADVRFLLTSEISCIYSKNGRTRKVHCLIFVPDFESAARINLALARIGNIASDGRPILGLDAKLLFGLAMDAAPEAIFVPAHAWTPHFSVFGAVSGFDSLEECFEEFTPSIRAIETGLSSDPAMNRRLSALDAIQLISNSDAHSAAKLGREATVFAGDPSYGAIRDALATGRNLAGTIEFFPEEGKYHWDGHRACGVRLSPSETIRSGYLCPDCGKKVTVGVMHRVEKLADRPAGFKPEGAPPYRSLIPLAEIIAEARGVGVTSKAVGADYMRLLATLGNEYKILMDSPLDDIECVGSPLIREAVSRVRSGDVDIAPGYDGEYGQVRIFSDVERREAKGQLRLL
jgi:uncharacterized protein (TIGR00375 family)